MRWRSVTTRPLLTMAAATVLLWALMPALASAHAAVDPLIAISGTPREAADAHGRMDRRPRANGELSVAAVLSHE